MIPTVPLLVAEAVVRAIGKGGQDFLHEHLRVTDRARHAPSNRIIPQLSSPHDPVSTPAEDSGRGTRNIERAAGERSQMERIAPHTERRR